MNKTLYAMVLLCLSFGTSMAQNVFPPNDNVGIGTNSPNAKLHVVASNAMNVLLSGNTKDHVGPELNLKRSNSLPYIGQSPAIQFGDEETNGGSMIQSYQGNLQFFTAATSWLEAMRIQTNGNVGIGTASPDSKLTVNGTIHSKEVKVDLNVPGPDYVFENNYQLMDIQKLKAYLSTNKHLPEIPSAKNMETSGIKLSEMNMLLLKKVEELTLYLIAQDKKLKESEEKQRTQDKRLKQLENAIESLRKTN